MSIRLLSLVWERAPHKDGALLVLLALADFSNDAGLSWPAVETLAHKARMTERHTRRLLRQLTKDGLIEVEERGKLHQANRYRIAVAKLGEFPERTKCQPSDEAPPASELRTLDVLPPGETAPPMSPDPSTTVKEPPTGGEKKKEDETSLDAVNFVVWFLKLLKETEAREPVLTDAIRANWADCYEKMIRIDGRSKKEVAAVCRWARTDDFWSGNFLSPMKLRQKNDGGVMYYDFFLHRMEHPTNGNKNQRPNPRSFEQRQSYAGVENV